MTFATLCGFAVTAEPGPRTLIVLPQLLTSTTPSNGHTTMRFLLYPRRSSLGRGSASYALSKPAVATKARPAALHPDASNDHEHHASNAVAAFVALADKSSPRGPSSTTMALSPATVASRRRAWGQQCSENCGCVVRFEADIRDGTVESASYHAKQLVLSRPGTAGTSSPPVPGLTTKGRPMFKACECPSLHHLSGAVVDHMVGTTVSRLKNTLEFRSTRSSPSFRTAALQAQGLSASSGAKCFDLVEEAVTALLKGHLPAPRPCPDPPLPDLPRTPWGDPDAIPPKKTEIPRTAWLDAHGHHDYHDDEEEAFPNVFWRPASSSFRHIKGVDDPYRLSPTSTLRLLDLANHDDRTEMTDSRGSLGRRLDDDDGHDDGRLRRYGPGKKTRHRRGVPRDWVSYVDELHWRHESSA